MKITVKEAEPRTTAQAGRIKALEQEIGCGNCASNESYPFPGPVVSDALKLICLGSKSRSDCPLNQRDA